jgi:hypothetical protein
MNKSFREKILKEIISAYGGVKPNYCSCNKLLDNIESIIKSCVPMKDIGLNDDNVEVIEFIIYGGNTTNGLVHHTGWTKQRAEKSVEETAIALDVNRNQFQDIEGIRIKLMEMLRS